MTLDNGPQLNELLAVAFILFHRRSGDVHDNESVTDCLRLKICAMRPLHLPCVVGDLKSSKVDDGNAAANKQPCDYGNSASDYDEPLCPHQRRDSSYV